MKRWLDFKIDQSFSRSKET